MTEVVPDRFEDLVEHLGGDRQGAGEDDHRPFHHGEAENKGAGQDDRQAEDVEEEGTVTADDLREASFHFNQMLSPIGALLYRSFFIHKRS